MIVNIVGSLKKQFDWKTKIELGEIKKISTEELLKKIGLVNEKAHMFGFFLINGKKIDKSNLDFLVKDDDLIKLFPKTFGG